MVDIRFLAGDETLVADVAASTEGWARRYPGAFAQALADDATRRAERFGSTAHLLEPDLKEGAGGWRDLHSIWLLESAVGMPLEEAGLLAAASAKRSRPRRSSSSGPAAPSTSRRESGGSGWSSIISPRSRGRWGSRTSRGSSRSTA